MSSCKLSIELFIFSRKYFLDLGISKMFEQTLDFLLTEEVKDSSACSFDSRFHGFC